MANYVFGVDVGGTTVKLGLFDIDGNLQDKLEIPTRTENGGVNILPDVAASVQAKMEEKGITKDDVAGVGIGAPGPVDGRGIIHKAVNLGWSEMNLKKELSELLGGMQVEGGNDANVAALGEMWQGGGKGYSDIVMVTLGTGVGGGVILNQKIVSGKHGLAGEIGHIRIREGEKESCNCGGHGCVEQIASATGIAREARRAMAANPETASAMRRFGDAVTAKDVLDCAKEGDAMALEVMETVGYYLGWALAVVSMTVDPELFVIGGGVSKAGSFLIDFIQKYYERFTPISENKAGITLATLGNDAGIYGAARLLL